MSALAIGGLLLLQSGDLAGLQRALQTLREQVAPAVVAIEVSRGKDPEGRGGSGSAGAHVDYYNRPEGPCTGTIWSPDGYIITSAFNVSGEIRRITVRTSDGKSHEATRLGFDQKRDIALLKIEAKDLAVLPRVRWEGVRQGDFVAIVGRAPDPDVPTLNHGILSALNRMNRTAVQTDAELNYGNVGGPLVTLQGELIGVTSHIRPRAHWGQSGGVGFATKHAEIEKVLAELKANRSILRGTGAPWTGVTPAEGAEGVAGVPIAGVAEGSPAEQAGLRDGDVLLEWDGKKVSSWAEIEKDMATRKVGERVRVKVEQRDPATGVAATKDVHIVLAESPE